MTMEAKALAKRNKDLEGVREKARKFRHAHPNDEFTKNWKRLSKSALYEIDPCDFHADLDAHSCSSVICRWRQTFVVRWEGVIALRVCVRHAHTRRVSEIGQETEQDTA